MNSQKPNHETERLAVLQDYEILDTEPEQAFDDLATVAAKVCETPIALVSLVDRKRQWFKSSVGIDATETPRDHLSFCAYAILSDDVMVVKDATVDPRFSTNPLVVREPKIRFYAGAPLHARGGHRVGTLCVIDVLARDLSDDQRDTLEVLSRQVVAQLDLRHRNRRLERAELELLRLREEVQSRASRADRSIECLDTFALAASTELKSPLQRLTGIVQRLLDDDRNVLSEASQELVLLLFRRVQRMESLLDQLLEYARAGRSMGGVEEIDTAELVAEAVRGLSWMTDSFLVHAHDLPSILGQRAPLHQVLRNLISNAIRHHAGASARIEVFGRILQDHVEISVRDDGPGIPEECHDQIFGMFQTLRPQADGSGVGLAIVKKTVESFGGEVRVVSVLGQGSTFSFTWPLVSSA